MEGQKKRTANFSKDEKRILSELVLKYQKLVENKRTDATTNAAKTRGWIRLAEEYNNISTYCHRNYTALKCCWENIKRQTKKDGADRKKKIFMTGGGNPPSPPPSNGEPSKIVEAILGPALEGIPNNYDSDAGVSINEIIELKSPEEEEIYTIEYDTEASIPKENNESDWSAWTPKNLKTPVSKPLKVSQNEEEWIKRRRPKNNSMGDTLIREKIQLVKILQENAIKEASIRLAILQEQLKQEKLKTQKWIDNN